MARMTKETPSRMRMTAIRYGHTNGSIQTNPIPIRTMKMPTATIIQFIPENQPVGAPPPPAPAS
jgi:hypothetical protein